MNNLLANLTVSHLAVICVAIAASLTDLRTSRIPNVLTFGAALAALVYAGVTGGWAGVGTTSAGWVVGVLLFFPFFALGGLGAGDVKLLGALGAWLGPREVFWVALYASMAGGVMALVVALATGYLGQAAANLRLLLTHWRVVGVRPLDQLSLKNERAPRLAYALPITAGVLVMLWIR
jgi:prepilin peptidase CpaA